ncbi:hypothetical protein V499_00145 [Pseudogymnoascus sp. VKM F-103]|nr:hypothetical protein V499_00145 [Pseudogymnoascus sp. VKM F-103]
MGHTYPARSVSSGNKDQQSLDFDPRAPVHVPDDCLDALPPDPALTELEQKREQLKAGTYRIQGTSIEAEVRRLTAVIGSPYQCRSSTEG